MITPIRNIERRIVDTGADKWEEMRIRVDGLPQWRRFAWHVDLDFFGPDDKGGSLEPYPVPEMNDNERLRETAGGYMEIVTFPLDKRVQPE